MPVLTYIRNGAAILALVLAAVPVHVSAQDSPQRLSPSEPRSFALGLLQQGETQAARALALGLLRKDSRDYIALMVLAEAERSLGRPAQAKFAARRAWRSTDVEKERFAAAFMMSGILKAEEKYSQAQLWLRRAGTATDEPRYEAAARKEYRRVQAANPWSLSFNFSLAPTSNVNGGPNDNTYTIGDLVFVDPTAVPLSGVEVGTMLNITHRLKPAEWGRVSFGLRYDERRYMLSSAAKHAVPTASGSDYAFKALDVHMRIDFASKKERARTTAEIGLSQAWQAGERIATLSLAYLPAAPLLGAQASFSGALQLREYDRLRYGSTLRRDQKLSLSANFVFEQIDYMGFSPSLTLNATRNISNKTLFDTQELGLSLGIKSTF